MNIRQSKEERSLYEKTVIGLICLSLIAMVSINNIYAEDTEMGNEFTTCSLDNSAIENRTIVNKKFDSQGNLESFDVIVSVPVEDVPVVEPQSITTVIVTIYRTCKIAKDMGAGFNPCTYLAVALGRAIINGTPKWDPADYGDWKVVRTSHNGYKPGCEPRHSQGCNGFYYTYSYTKIK